MSFTPLDTLVGNNTGVRDRLFKFILQNSSIGILESEYTPDGWREGELTYQRDEIYHGVFRKYSTNELIFVKDARDYLRDVYESQGISAECKLTIQILDKSDFTYKDYFVGKIDFTTYDISELGVRVGIIDDSFTEKFKSRDEIDLNVFSNEAIDGAIVPAFTVDELTLRSKPFYFEATHDDSGTLSTVELSPNVTYIQPRLGIFETDYSESNVPGVVVAPIDESWAFFQGAQRDYSFTLQGSVSGSITGSGPIPQASFRLQLWSDVSGSWLIVQTLDTDNQGNSTTAPKVFNYNFSFSTTYNAVEGESLALVVFTDVDTITASSISNASLSYVSSVNFSESTIKAIPVWEAFWRLAQKMTSLANPIESDYFNRTDTPDPSLTDGEAQFFTRGTFIRGQESNNDTLAMSFRDLFKSMDSLHRIGVGTFIKNGFTRLKIEELDYFYDANVILDISDRIRSEAIQKQVIPDMHYNEIATGYNSFSYELQGGLKEYNTKSVFSTILNNIKSKLDIVSKFRGDTQGIDLLRKAVLDNSTDDQKGDEDIFIIDSRKDGGIYYAREGSVADGFTSVSGGLGVEDSYNLRFTPKRNLLTWGASILAGVVKNLGSYIKWQTSDKFTELETQLTTETSPLAENTDVLVNDLNPNRWYNEKYVIEAPLYWEDVQAIESNPRGLIKLSDTQYGWILNIQTNSVEKLAQFELLRANLDVVTPINPCEQVPVADFDDSNIVVQQGYPVEIANLSTNICPAANCTWEIPTFPNPFNTTGSNPVTVFFTQSGIYAIKLTVSQTGGTDNITKNVRVIITA